MSVADYALVDFSLDTDPATAGDFVFSSVLRLNTGTTFNSGSVNFGLQLFGDAILDNAYRVRTSASGIFELQKRSGGGSYSDLTSNNFDAGSIGNGDVYTYTVTGTYIDTNADMVNDALSFEVSIEGAGITDGIQVISAVDNSPLSGTNFGYYASATSSSSTGRSIDITFDEFALVPEPTSAAMLVGGLGLLMLRRRRA